MSMDRVVLGVDGGGSTVRAAVVTSDLDIIGQSEGGTANPSVVGHTAAARAIQDTMRAALDAAHVSADSVQAVGIGIAGAAAHHSAGWLRTVVTAIMPQAHVAPSADFEIALAGALGERKGVIVLAGTGSLAYGVNAAGESALVGGWGYLLDDSGSGYWLGRRGLEAVVRAGDGRGDPSTLTDSLLGALGMRKPLDLVPWLYHANTSRTRAVAALAPLVLHDAETGDAVATAIVTEGVEELTLAARTVIRRLSMRTPKIAFAGGVLTSPNVLSTRLAAVLELDSLPVPRYPPVIGAALLALMQLNTETGDSL